MKTRSNAHRSLGSLLFSVGILLGIVLTIVTAWPDYEATLYFVRMASGTLTTLRCPLLITTSETATITATFNNTTDNALSPTARAEFSKLGVFRTELTKFSVEPHEKKRLEWTISADDVDMQVFALARVFFFPQYPYPSREAACGMFVLDVPWLTGGQIFTIAVGVCLASLLAGLVLVESRQPPSKRSREMVNAMRVLAVLILAAMLTSFLGMWLAGVALLAISVLLVTTILYMVATRPPIETSDT